LTAEERRAAIVAVERAPEPDPEPKSLFEAAVSRRRSAG
jgi:hypothetical protein